MSNNNKLNSPKQNTHPSQHNYSDKANRLFESREIETHYMVHLWEDSSTENNDDEDTGTWTESVDFLL